MKTLILGLGNLLLSDDGVGIRVAQILEAGLASEQITVMEASLAGLNMLDLLPGYDRAIIVDAIQTPGGEPGKIYRLDMEAFAGTLHYTSPHDINFATALELGKKLGFPLPGQIIIFAIEVQDITTFSEDCTPLVKKAIPVCAEMIVHEIQGGSPD